MEQKSKIEVWGETLAAILGFILYGVPMLFVGCLILYAVYYLGGAFIKDMFSVIF